ncbi:hypothetical protein [Streptomyces sp. NPDC050355]|uniref:hypothetical protein n=1 Tax=Streptomyces sp. NPDC050355 TaxID=3365609 RepID=UPI0037A8A56F
MSEVIRSRRADVTQCIYLVDWTATKLRRALTVGRAERDTLRELATGCEDTDVEHEPV